MNIHFIGTGAADWDWTLPLASGVRGSTSTLLDGHILIDAGPTVLSQMEQQGIKPGDITDILITHSHSDHFNPAIIEAIAAAPRTEKLRIYSTEQALKRINDTVEKIQLVFAQEFTIRELKFLPLPANHALTDITENAFHFLIDTPDSKRLLYALDGGWMMSATRTLLKFDHIDMIIWDATSGNCFNDWRFADHNELAMIRNMRIGMVPLELINDNTIHVFDHIARTLWPESAQERAKLAEEFQGILAEDGMKMTL